MTPAEESLARLLEARGAAEPAFLRALRAAGRDTLANTRPVARAVSVRPVIDSTTTTAFAADDSGESAP